MRIASLCLVLGLLACDPDATPHPVSKPAAVDSEPKRGVPRVQLPASEHYTRRLPRLAWGAPCAVEALTRGVRRFRAQSDFEGQLIISDMSTRAGPTPPHRTHDTGHDVDIRLPTTVDDDRWRERPPHAVDVDWIATWQLVVALSETEGVGRVNLHHAMQALLHDAVRRAGEDGDRLNRLLQFPRPRLEPAGFVRHGSGMAHLHVHFECSYVEERT